MGAIRATSWHESRPFDISSEWGAPPPEQVIAHANLYWQWQAAPGRKATVVSSADLSF